MLNILQLFIQVDVLSKNIARLYYGQMNLVKSQIGLLVTHWLEHPIFTGEFRGSIPRTGTNVWDFFLGMLAIYGEFVIVIMQIKASVRCAILFCPCIVILEWRLSISH